MSENKETMDEHLQSYGRNLNEYFSDNLSLDSGKAWRIGIYENNKFLQYKDSKLWINRNDAIDYIGELKKQFKHKTFIFKLVEFKFEKIQQGYNLHNKQLENK